MRNEFEIIHHPDNDDELNGPIEAEYYEAQYEGMWGIGKTKEVAIQNLEGVIEGFKFDDIGVEPDVDYGPSV